MSNDELDDFFLEGGDELMNSESCPKCKEPIYLELDIKWADRKRRKGKINPLSRVKVIAV